MHSIYNHYTINNRWLDRADVESGDALLAIQSGRPGITPLEAAGVEKERTMSSEKHWPSLSPLRTGLRGKCPRCGKGRIFQGFLTLRGECEVCHLDYSFADPADGPAFFVICFACIPCVVFAIWIEVQYSAPYWVHLVTSLPAILLTCIPPLRPLKGWLVATQFFYKAGEATRAETLIPGQASVASEATTSGSR